jgi:RecA-family ATPase
MKVMFWSLEMNHPAIKSFLETMATTLSSDDIQTLEQNFKIVPLGEVIALDTKEGQAFMNNLIEEYKPDGVFIDSMGKVTYSELTDEKKIKELNGYYASLRAKYGPFLFFVHHQRKATGDNKKPKNLADLYGNQYIAAEASVVINLWLEEDNSIEVSAIKTRLMARPRPYHIDRTSDLQFHVKAMEDTTVPEIKEAHADGVNGQPGKSGKNRLSGL